ncbi:energy transducer TonB [Pelagicoccus sp. NFK12]|uniref:Energy transducer TonB n=1 Tax=Pelagicoccus enzymogenes TaxID=2773457 RepID=A0A927F9S6_9BACT|nr:energy transducer TonB [Pelagicoccus enzymogenes]MBD5779523.1 energy transducer TonB [Pelagicoccus enzymogenes]MDQ8200314.1 energy transducer TonB [Pelagicoccus enzymogenes]
MNRFKSSLTSLLILALAAFAANAVSAADAKWDVQPSVKKSVAPANPNGIEGMAMALVTISADGTVASVTIDKSTDASLEQPVLDAIKQWRFNPAQLNGSPIECSIKVPFKFKS